MAHKTDYQLMVDAIDHMKITPKQKEFVRAAMRAAIEYACMVKAGFELDPPKKESATSALASASSEGGK